MRPNASKIAITTVINLLGTLVTPLSLPWIVLSSEVLAQTNEAQKAEYFLNLCREHLSNNQAEAAIQSCQQAVTAHQQIKERSGEAKATVNLGIAYGYANQLEQSITKSTILQKLPYMAS